LCDAWEAAQARLEAEHVEGGYTNKVTHWATSRTKQPGSLTGELASKHDPDSR
jgi:hypothetical protein